MMKCKDYTDLARRRNCPETGGAENADIVAPEPQNQDPPVSGRAMRRKEGGRGGCLLSLFLTRREAVVFLFRAGMAGRVALRDWLVTQLLPSRPAIPSGSSAHHLVPPRRPALVAR